MFDSIKTELKVNGPSSFDPPSAKPPRKKIPWGPVVIVAAISLLIVGILLLSFSWLKSKYTNWRVPKTTVTEVSTNTPRLANNLPTDEINASSTNPQFTEKVKIEYLSFGDFYKAKTDDWGLKAENYVLPLNVKIDVANYYEVSRELNLDPALAGLNEQGIAVIDNPWNKDTKDFYGIYSRLIQKKLPLLITTDFLTYNYQNKNKQIFKDIEAKVFYESLWNINKELYLVAKNRYEEHLARVGNVNDAILESERLELAYLAVAMELLKPTGAQINSEKNSAQVDKFTPEEIGIYAFPLPPYLQADVERELTLIREAKTTKTLVKSPVLLYLRNYGDFSVPTEYRTNAHLSNFYLTLRWLNSVWPLNYKTAACPACLLDREDWRINLTASAWLAKDFSANPLLKQRWAKIYKIIYYFKGLRDDFNYVYYRDSLSSMFGDNYNPEELFGEANPEAEKNLESWRAKLLTANFLDISGGTYYNGSNDATGAGLKILADFYWPNDYIFKQLTYPFVGSYNMGTPSKDNTTSCRLAGGINRCNGFALDVLGIVYDSSDSNNYWKENISYDNYSNNLEIIKNNLATSNVWHNNNYWSTLVYIGKGLNTDINNLPSYAAGSNWNSHILRSAVSAWVNLQLPLDKLGLQIQDKSNLQVISRSSENVYVEPNLSQVNELIADSEMMLEMFKALELSEEANIVNVSLESSITELNVFKGIMKKELEGVALSPDDNQFILNFSQGYKTDSLGSKQLSLTALNQSKKIWREDLSNLRLMLLISSVGGKKTLSVGPVWDYKESRN